MSVIESIAESLFTFFASLVVAKIRSILFIAKILGIIFILYGVWLAAQTTHAIIQFPKTQGIVVNNKFKTPSGTTSYASIVEFTLPNGTVSQITPNESTNSQPLEVGDKVSVHYDPTNPKNGYVNTWYYLGNNFLLILSGLIAFGIYWVPTKLFFSKPVKEAVVKTVETL